MAEPTQSASREWAGKIPRYGLIGSGRAWEIVQNAFYWDKVEDAYEAALEIGDASMGASLGFFRLVEGEALTRQHSTIIELTPWLSLEAHQHPSPDLQSLGELVVQTCEAVGRRLQWDFREKTLVSVLVPEADVPWHSGRYGYCIDKYPFDKVCIPTSALSEGAHLTAVLAHEYAHVVTINQSSNRAPQWVEEGVSQTMEPRNPEEARAIFRAHPERWRSAHELEFAFGMERREGQNREAVAEAYGQALVLVEALRQQGGDEKLSQFLTAFSETGLWEAFKVTAFNHQPAEDALKRTYGINQEELFERARPN